MFASYVHRRNAVVMREFDQPTVEIVVVGSSESLLGVLSNS
jgi:hypothetical protein